MDKVMFSSARHDWETPQDLFDNLHREFDFTVDVCATEENAKLDTYLTPEIDALSISWRGHRCWMNPPYGRETIKWVRKAATEALYHPGTLVVGLLPARTDARWWHDYVMQASEIRLIRGRLRFIGAESAAPFPSCIVIWDRPVLIPRFVSADRVGNVLPAYVSTNTEAP